MKAQVLQQQDSRRTVRSRPLPPDGSDAVIGEGDGRAQQAARGPATGFGRSSPARAPLALGPVEVGDQDDLGRRRSGRGSVGRAALQAVSSETWPPSMGTLKSARTGAFSPAGLQIINGAEGQQLLLRGTCPWRSAPRGEAPPVVIPGQNLHQLAVDDLGLGRGRWMSWRCGSGQRGRDQGSSVTPRMPRAGRHWRRPSASLTA